MRFPDEVALTAVGERSGDNPERVEVRPRPERNCERSVPVIQSPLDEQIDGENADESDQRSPRDAEE